MSFWISGWGTQGRCRYSAVSLITRFDFMAPVTRVITALQCILILCVLKNTRLFKKAHAVFDQGRGFERGEGREFAIPLMAFFNIHVKDIFTTY